MSKTVVSEDLLFVATAFVWTVSITFSGFRGWTSRSSRHSPSGAFGHTTLSTGGQTAEQPEPEVFGEIYRRRALGSLRAASSGAGLKDVLSLLASFGGAEQVASEEPVPKDSFALNFRGPQLQQMPHAEAREVSGAANGSFHVAQSAGVSTGGGVHADATGCPVGGSLDAVASFTVTSPAKKGNSSIGCNTSGSATCSIIQEAPTVCDMTAFELVRSNQAYCDVKSSEGATTIHEPTICCSPQQPQHGALPAANPLAVNNGCAFCPQLARRIAPAPVHEHYSPALCCCHGASSTPPATSASVQPWSTLSTSDPGGAAGFAATAFALVAATVQPRSFGGAVASQSPPPVQGFDMCRVRCNISFIPENEEIVSDDEDENDAGNGDEGEDEAAASTQGPELSHINANWPRAVRRRGPKRQSVCEGIYELRRLLLPTAPVTPQPAQRVALMSEPEPLEAELQQLQQHSSSAHTESVSILLDALVAAESSRPESSTLFAPEPRSVDGVCPPCSCCCWGKPCICRNFADQFDGRRFKDQAPGAGWPDETAAAAAVSCCDGNGHGRDSTVEISCVNGDMKCGATHEGFGGCTHGRCLSGNDCGTLSEGAARCADPLGPIASCGGCLSGSLGEGEPVPKTPSQVHPHLSSCSPRGKVETSTANADAPVAAAAAKVAAGLGLELDDGDASITFPLGPGCEPSAVLSLGGSSGRALVVSPRPQLPDASSPRHPLAQQQHCGGLSTVSSALVAAQSSTSLLVQAATIRARGMSRVHSRSSSCRGGACPVPEQPLESVTPERAASPIPSRGELVCDAQPLPIDPSASPFSRLRLNFDSPRLSSRTRYHRMSTASGDAVSTVSTPRSTVSTPLLYCGGRRSRHGTSMRQQHRMFPSCLSHNSHPHPRRVVPQPHPLTAATTLKASAAAGTPAVLAAAERASTELCRRREAREQLVQQAATFCGGGTDCPSYLRPTLSFAAKSLAQHQHHQQHRPNPGAPITMGLSIDRPFR